ncbi:hypothetical protein QLX08_000834 [Tetragonisca angustula]
MTLRRKRKMMSYDDCLYLEILSSDLENGRILPHLDVIEVVITEPGRYEDEEQKRRCSPRYPDRTEIRQDSPQIIRNIAIRTTIRPRRTNSSMKNGARTMEVPTGIDLGRETRGNIGSVSPNTTGASTAEKRPNHSEP